MLHKEVVKELDFDHVFFSDQIGVNLGGMRILLFLLIINALILLCPELEVLLLDGHEQLAQRLVLFAGVILAHNHLRQRSEQEEVHIHDALVFYHSDEVRVEVADLCMGVLCASNQELKVIRFDTGLVFRQSSKETIKGLFVFVALS